MSIGALNIASYKACAANFTGNVKSGQGAVVGFLCTVAGTLNLYDDAAVGTAAPVVQGLNVTAGVWYPMPFALGSGINLVLTGGAAGSLSWA